MICVCTVCSVLSRTFGVNTMMNWSGMGCAHALLGLHSSLTAFYRRSRKDRANVHTGLDIADLKRKEMT